MASTETTITVKIDASEMYEICKKISAMSPDQLVELGHVLEQKKLHESMPILAEKLQEPASTAQSLASTMEGPGANPPAAEVPPLPTKLTIITTDLEEIYQAVRTGLTMCTDGKSLLKIHLWKLKAQKQTLATLKTSAARKHFKEELHKAFCSAIPLYYDWFLKRATLKVKNDKKHNLIKKTATGMATKVKDAIEKTVIVKGAVLKNGDVAKALFAKPFNPDDPALQAMAPNVIGPDMKSVVEAIKVSPDGLIGQIPGDPTPLKLSDEHFETLKNAGALKIIDEVPLPPITLQTIEDVLASAAKQKTEQLLKEKQHFVDHVDAAETATLQEPKEAAIDDFIDFVKTKAGDLQFFPEPFEFEPMLAESELVDIGALKLTFQGRPLARITKTLYLKFMEIAETVKKPECLELKRPYIQSVEVRNLIGRNLRRALKHGVCFISPPDVVICDRLPDTFMMLTLADIDPALAGGKGVAA